MKKFNPTHFYVIFDPFLNKKHFTRENNKNTQGHEFQRELNKRLRKKDGNSNNCVYLYWGKISVTEKPSRDYSEFKQVLENNKKHNYPTHLYISDFHHFWVAKIDDICFGDEQEYYNNSLDFFKDFQGKNKIEAWFKVIDIDLIGNTKEETHNYISGLVSENKGKSIELSPYVSNLQYPVFVQDLACVEPFHFNSSEPIVLSKQIENESFYEKIKMVINKYCVNKDDWELLKPSVQREIIRAEMDYFEQKSHNWNNLYFSYFKALEWQLNHIVVNYLKSSNYSNQIKVLKNKNGQSNFYTPNNPNGTTEEIIPLNDYDGNFSISIIINTVFANHKNIVRNKNNSLIFSDMPGLFIFINNELREFLNDNQIINTRNILIHEDSLEIDETDFLKIRKELLGIGKTGLLFKLAEYTSKSKIEEQKKSA